MSNIDERIVKMSFDNKDFQKGINETLESLEKLNNVLKNSTNVEIFSGLSKSLKDVKGQLSTLNLDELNKVNKTESIWTKFGNALSSVSRGIAGFVGKLNIGGTVDKLGSSFNNATEGSNGLGKSIDTVASKLSTLGVIGVTALANITNKAVNAGMQLLKSFAIDPITDGFGEYELKMNSIQTILTNTAKHGTTLDDVNKALNELNTYSDKTIYNFAEMTDNIGKATAAGLKLDDSVTFVKGMANVAAGFGVDATRMAGATYQMTQALSAGVIQLQDWRSMEMAGMGGEMLQDELIKTAKAMGVNVDATKAFRDTLKDGWLTSDIFIKTMERMANDPSLTLAAENVTSFTKLLGTLKETVGSGWAQSFEHIFGNKDQSTQLWTGISKSLGEIINKSAEARNKVLEFWNANGGRDAVISGLGNIFTSLGKVLGSVKEAFQEVFPPMTGDKLVELSNKFKDFTEKIKITDDAAKKIKDVFKGVFTVFDTVKDSVVDLFTGFTPLGGALKTIGSTVLDVAASIGRMVTNFGQAIQKADIFKTLGSGIKTVCGWASTAISELGDMFSELGKGLGKIDFSKIFGAIGDAFKNLGDFLKPITEGIGKAIESISFDSIIKTLNTGVLLTILTTVKDTFKKVGEVGDSAKGIFDSFKDIGKKAKGALDAVRESLESWQTNLKSDTLMKIASAIGVLTLSLMVLSSIDGKSLAKGLTGLAVAFTELVIAYGAIVAIGGMKGMFSTATSLVVIATAILILSGALKVLSTIEIGEMVTGLVGLAVSLGTMIAAVKLFDTSGGNLGKTATSLMIFGVALIVMAGALKLLGSIDAETLGSGLFSLAVLLGELAAFLAVSKFGDLGPSTATGILILSAALIVLSQAVKQFGSLNHDEIIKGLAGIAGILTEIAIFSKFSGGGLDMVGIGVGLAAISAAMLVMSAAIQSLGSMQWDELGRGLTVMAGGLLILGVASATISGGKMMLLGAGIGVMSVALLLLSAALQSMGGMSWEEIGKSLAVLAGSLTILAVAMIAMSGAIGGAVAMVVMAGALALLTPQLLLLGSMSLGEIGLMLLALAGAFTVLGVAGLLLSPIVIPLMGLGVAVALLGVGCLAAGAGVTAIGTGIGILAAAVAGGGNAIVDFIEQLIQLLPEIGTKAAEGFGNFMVALAEAAPKIATGMTTIVGCMLDALLENATKFVETGVQLVLMFAEGLSTAIPQLVTYGMQMITGILTGIADNIGKLADEGARAIVNFLDGVARNLPKVIQSGIDLVLSFVEGIANGLNSNRGRLEAAMRNLIDAMIKAGLAAIKGSISGFVSGGKELMDGFCKGIKGMLSAAGSAVKSCVDAAVKAASNLGDKLVSAGKSLIEGFVKGIKDKAASVAKAATDVVSKAIEAAKSALKINSPSKVFIAIGGSVNEGFARGLDKYSDESASAASNLANTVIKNVKDPLSNISKILNDDIDVNPVIAPVLDLSNIQAGTRALDGMLQDGTMQINGVTGRLAGTIGSIQNGNSNSDIVSALNDLKNSMNNSNGNTYQINGITYDDGTGVSNAVQSLIRATKIERRM